jgi:hypothetical protein
MSTSLAADDRHGRDRDDDDDDDEEGRDDAD